MGTFKTFLTGVDLGADVIQIFHEGNKFIVEGTGTLCDFLRVEVLLCQSPQILNGLQGGEQGGGTDEYNIAIEGVE